MKESDSIREDQAREGRRMTGTINLVNGSGQRLQMPLRRHAAAPKEKLKGHENLLRDLEKSGAEITIEWRDKADKTVGIVKHSDPFTVSVQTADGATTVFFKHAMLGITPSPRAKADEEQ